MKYAAFLFLGGTLLLSVPVVVWSHAQEATPPRPAVPIEPIGAILDAFRSHSVVALGEGDHGNEPGHAFRLSLIRDPRFAVMVNDIVVECGDSRYQDLMDRFVRGEDIPYASLRQVWQNTTVPGPVWDKPMYEEFFRAVRAVNASLPRERQIRVLLGDPPIDWDSVHSREDLVKWQKGRDTYPADLIRREVLAKQRRALVIRASRVRETRTASRRDRLVRMDSFKEVTSWSSKSFRTTKATRPANSRMPSCISPMAYSTD